MGDWCRKLIWIKYKEHFSLAEYESKTLKLNISGVAVKRCASGATAGDAAVAEYRIHFMYYDVWYNMDLWFCCCIFCTFSIYDSAICMASFRRTFWLVFDRFHQHHYRIYESNIRQKSSQAKSPLNWMSESIRDAPTQNPHKSVCWAGGLVGWCGTDTIPLTLRFVKRYFVCSYVSHNTGIQNGSFNGIK